MSINTTERTNITKLVVGMFNATPGAFYLADIATAFEANGHSLLSLARSLSQTAIFKTLFPAFQSAAQFAAAFLTPLGLQSNQIALDFVTSKVNAGMDKGEVIYSTLVALLATTASEFAPAKAILNNKADVAEYYAVTKSISSTDINVLKAALVGVTSDTATIIAAKAAIDAPPPSPEPSGALFTLTTGNDTVTGTNSDDTINGTLTGAFESPDSIDGLGGMDTLTVTDSASLSTVGTTVKNVEIAALTSGGSITTNTTAWTGLTSLALSAVGAVNVTGAATHTINVTETGAGQLTAGIVVDGGSAVTVASAHQTSGTILIGSTTPPTGAVTVTSSVDASSSGGTITVNGGTTVSVTQTSTHTVGTTVTKQSDVTVNGIATTTAVTVVQPSVVAAATAVTAVTGVGGIAAITASPGTQPVTAVTGVIKVDAITGAAGVTQDGAVQITDFKYNTVTANSISNVTLANYDSFSFIRSNALTTLVLSGTAGTLALTNATNGAGGVPTASHALALTVNGLSGSNTITVTNNDINILNVTTTGADSKLSAFADTGLTTLNVTGTKVFRLDALNASLTSIVISGSAGFHDGGSTASNGFAARGAGTTLVTTSSGTITASLDSATQSFIGATGVDTIRISSTADATQIITGGSSTSDELILEGGAYALTSATGTKVTGFEILGVAANVTGTIDVTQLGSPAKLHIIGNSTVVFTKVANNASVTLDVASSSVTVGLADANGAADTISVTLGRATSDTVNFGTLVLKDTNAVGIGTVNLVSNGVDITAGDSTPNNNTIVLTDNGLANLNFSGTQGLQITTLNEATTQATAITLNNTNTSSFGLNIGVLTDTNLGALTFTGTGLSNITTLTAASVNTITISNTGTQLATVRTYTSSAALNSLTLNGNVQIGDGLVGGTGLTSTASTGITVSGATDHAHVKLSLGAATTGLTNNITLGNGNNVVTDATIAGTSNITLGTGSNFVTAGGATTNTTGRYHITLGTGTGPDYITVGTGGTTYATAANYTITGAQAGDRIIFNTDAAATLVGHTAGVITQTVAGGTLALTITAIETAVDALAAHGVAYAVFGGNTYIAESISSTLGGTDTTIVEIIGTHTVTAGTAGVGGYLLITS